MRIRFCAVLAALTALLGLSAGPGFAQKPKGDPRDEAALLKNAEGFVEAFHMGDAKGLAAFWLPDGDYTNQTGQHLQGREAIEKAFKGHFTENKGLKLRIDIDSLKFLTPDVAVEDGLTSVIPPDGGPPSRARYTIVHVKRDGHWYLSSVRDAPFSAPTNHEHLKALDWMVGDWVSQPSQNGEIARVSFAWSASQNFIVSTFSTTFKNISVGSGTQWIAWDPMAKRIRAWTFESEGGFGEETFTRDGNKWLIKSTGIVRDGSKTRAIHILTRGDADTMTWQTRDRALGDTTLPDAKAITLKRIQAPN